ncbi:MAG: hypothetical protein DRI86_05865 [Bacteroidetes bacterium]|nr:MAG: hypothetical protein DRI86_05865 [Bacteroidota bacterium]
MSEIIITYSFWWILPIVLASFALSMLLYYKNKKEEFSSLILFLLATIRFFVFAILGILLLSPVIKSWKSRVEKPIVIIAVDNSKSMLLSKDSIKQKQKYEELIRKLGKEIGDDYILDYYSFGDRVVKTRDFNFRDKKTNLGSIFNTVKQRYEYSNVGAMILVSDGIYNVGDNPLYSAKSMGFPVYTIGVGDSSIRKDYAIQSVRYNKTVFVQNEFPIEVTLRAKQMNNSRSKVLLYNKEKLIKTKNINFNSVNDIQKLVFNVKSLETGMQSYKVVLQSFDGENNVANNSRVIYLDVLGEKKKVLLLYSNPHPDVSAIKQIFNKSDEYKLELKQFGKYSLNISDYDLIIYHQISSNISSSRRLFKEARLKNIPYIIIIGANSSISNFNSFRTGISIKSKNNSFIEINAINNSDFSDFIIPKQLKETIGNYPPLITAYGDYKVSSAFHTIFKQRIGSVDTEYPLISVSNVSGMRNAFIFGEGIWRWRMYDFMENKNHNLIDDFFLKLVRYTSLSKEHSRLNIQWEKSYSEQENVEFNAEFYNTSYELVHDADIKMEITNEENKKFVFAFGNKKLSDYLSAGRFSHGLYSFKASVNYSGQLFEYRGKFSVAKVELEAMNLEADYGLLRKIAFENSAEFYSDKKSDVLAQKLLEKDDIVNIETQYLQYKDLIKFPSILLILVVLLTLEWFLRKQNGSY